MSTNQNQGTTSITDKPDSVDGRTLRRTRNRDAVISSLLAMIREGDIHPAAADIADRAGVSHRSIFRYFDDLDDLVRTAIDRAFMDAGPMSIIPDIGSGTLSARVDALVTARVALYEHVDGAMQVARIRAHSIPSIVDEIAAVLQAFRDQVAVHFAAELADHDAASREQLIDAIVILTGYDAFNMHLRLLHHDTTTMRESLSASLRTLLGS